MKVGLDVLFTDKFNAAGTVSLKSASVGAWVDLDSAILAGATALDATGAQIKGALRWAPEAPVSGFVYLEDAAVGQLEDDWGPNGERGNGYWPKAGLLRLNGFTYNRLRGNHQPSVEQRLKWVQSQYSQNSGNFAPEPYEQLAKVFLQAGKKGDARKVAIARHIDERRYGNLDPYGKAGNWFFDKTIKYGYQTWRAALGLAIVFVAFLVMSCFALHHHAIVPVNDLVAAVDPVPVATHCFASYPCFYPLGYAVDVVIPVINVHQAEFWGLNGWGWVVGSWAATVLGWAAVTLLVVGYTGLVRQQ